MKGSLVRVRASALTGIACIATVLLDGDTLEKNIRFGAQGYTRGTPASVKPLQANQAVRPSGAYSLLCEVSRPAGGDCGSFMQRGVDAGLVRRATKVLETALEEGCCPS